MVTKNRKNKYRSMIINVLPLETVQQEHNLSRWGPCIKKTESGESVITRYKQYARAKLKSVNVIDNIACVTIKSCGQYSELESRSSCRFTHVIVVSLWTYLLTLSSN